MLFLFYFLRFIVLFIIKSSFYTLLILYKFTKFTVKFIKFLFKNKILRIPTALFVFGIIFNLNFSVLSTIYFLYLMHSAALYSGIYRNIYDNLLRFFSQIKGNSNIKDILKLLPSNNIILSNISLENDERTLNIYHLAITPNGLYNIIPLSNFLDKNTSKEVANKLIYDIYNQTENIKNLLVDIVEEDIPLTTLILSPEDYIDNNFNIDNFKLIQENQLLFMINSNKDTDIHLDINTIKDLIIENKAWFLDKVFFNFTYFLTNNKKIILFLMLCPIVYFIYILILNIFYSVILSLINDIIKLFYKIIKL